MSGPVEPEHAPDLSGSPGSPGAADGSDDHDDASGLVSALNVVGARWALLIVARLLDGPQRYGDLQRDLGVPTNMLATRLRELETAGVLSRLPLRHNTRAYALTERGLALRETIEALSRWGRARGEEPPTSG